MPRVQLIALALVALLASCKSMHFSHVAILPLQAEDGQKQRIQPEVRREATKIFQAFATNNGFEVKDVPIDPDLHDEHPPGQPTLGAVPLAKGKPYMILWVYPYQITVEVFMDARRKTPSGFFLTRNALLARLRAEFGDDRVVLQ
jgi:hypothetical protein